MIITWLHDVILSVIHSSLYLTLKHDYQVGFLCSFQVFIWQINPSRTIDCFKIWRRLLNIVPAEIAVNVLIGCLYILSENQRVNNCSRFLPGLRISRLNSWIIVVCWIKEEESIIFIQVTLHMAELVRWLYTQEKLSQPGKC